MGRNMEGKILIGCLVVALALEIGIKMYLKRKLKDIDGFDGKIKKEQDQEEQTLRTFGDE